MTIIIGSDHAGFDTKEVIIKALAKKGYSIVDIGVFSSKEKGDYPKIAERVAKDVASDRSTKGLLVCGSGTGMVIAANKVKGIRAAVIYDKYTAEMARKDNNANVATLRGRGFPAAKAAKIALHFLETKFSEKDRHKRRIRQISALDRK